MALSGQQKAALETNAAIVLNNPTATPAARDFARRILARLLADRSN